MTLFIKISPLTKNKMIKRKVKIKVFRGRKHTEKTEKTQHLINYSKLSFVTELL